MSARVPLQPLAQPRDALDQDLLALLAVTARASTADLARALKVARTTIVARLARLEREGIVSGYTVRLRQDLAQQRIVRVAGPDPGQPGARHAQAEAGRGRRAGPVLGQPQQAQQFGRIGDRFAPLAAPVRRRLRRQRACRYHCAVVPARPGPGVLKTRP